MFLSTAGDLVSYCLSCDGLLESSIARERARQQSDDSSRAAPAPRAIGILWLPSISSWLLSVKRFAVRTHSRMSSAGSG
jgi:hypothetical protein